MELILYLKPFIDMLWKFKILDVILIFIIFFITPMYMIKYKYKLSYIDFFILFIAILFTISLLNNFNNDAFIIYIKIMTNIYMIFIGRLIINIDSLDHALAKSYSIVVIMNLIYMLAGEGFIYWGNAKTFRGMYFFKTDLALAMLQAIVFIRIMMNSNKFIYRIISKGLVFFICPFLIILSNSRVYTLIYLLIIYIFYMQNIEIKTGKKYNFNLKFISKIIIIIFIGLTMYSYATEYIPWFKENGFITFKFNNLSELFSPANTQGRSVIWEITLNKFKSNSIFKQFMGVDLISDGAILNGIFYDSHSNYVKILYSIGYIGIILFTCLIIVSINMLNNVSIQIKYTFIMLLSMYLISSISVPNIINTNQSFLFFLYLGAITRSNNLKLKK